MLFGEVKAFDAASGLGVARAQDGQEYPFHCTELSDGSRDVQVGAAVVFDVVPGQLGRWEARRVGRRA